jgi:hypothetical protein
VLRLCRAERVTEGANRCLGQSKRADQRVRVAQFHRGKPDRRILELLSLDRED